MRPNAELRRQVIAIYKGMHRVSLRTSIECLFPAKFTEAIPNSYSSAANILLVTATSAPRLHKAFMSRAAERDEDKIRAGIKQAEYVKKEIEAL
ncbi:hypothetical protein TrVGV298_011986 [Trichoderma virens]|nr:hypothetical protein TrVGV298_011986 [Trichoderma virens]